MSMKEPSSPFGKESAQEQPRAAVATEAVQEKPKFTPEETEAIKKVSADLKAEHDMLSGELENVMMTPAIANEEKVKALLAEYFVAEKSGDRQAQQEAHEKFVEADKQHKSRTYRVDFLKRLINQSEIKMGLSPERKLALTKLKGLHEKYPRVMREDRSAWIDRPGELSLHDDPIRFSEDGTYELDGLNLDEFKNREEAERFTKELPDGLRKIDYCSVDGKTMDLAPGKIGYLFLGTEKFTERNEKNAKAFAEQVKKFLQQDREVDEVSSGESLPIYGSYARTVEDILAQLPASEIKLKLARDKYGYASINRTTRSGGNPTPVADYLVKSFPKQAKE